MERHPLHQEPVPPPPLSWLSDGLLRAQNTLLPLLLSLLASVDSGDTHAPALVPLESPCGPQACLGQSPPLPDPV